MLKCKKCGNNLFTIEIINDCFDCKYNLAFDEEEDAWISDQDIIDKKELIRNSAETDGECALGTAGFGCWIVACDKCKHSFNIAFAE